MSPSVHQAAIIEPEIRSALGAKLNNLTDMDVNYIE
jgi:hypothetical protein